MSVQQLLSRIHQLEENSRFVHNALELTLSLVDFQENINSRHDGQHILHELLKRINLIISFDVGAIYLVDEITSDITLNCINPRDQQQLIENEIDFMTDKGLFAWALREKRGIRIKSKDKQREFLYHQIATYSRIKGLFVGLLPENKHPIPDAARNILSLILLNAANALENLDSYGVVLKENTLLEEETRKRTQSLIEYEKRLQHAQKMEAIGTLAGGVAHDLNNILSGITSYPEMLPMDLPPDSTFHAPLKIIKKSGEKAAAIVQDLLTLARRGVCNMTPTNLNDVVVEYLESPEFERLQLYHPLVRIKTEMDKKLMGIYGSPVHLSKALMNLVSNAAESIEGEGKVCIRTANRQIDLSMDGFDTVRQGSYVTISVTDTGTGISPADMERIFEPFYTKKIMGRSGTGLGMAVVWGTVKDHNGHIDIRTDQGKGTCFTLFFPAVDMGTFANKTALNPEQYKGNGESILIVDDVEEQRTIATEILTHLGYSVRAVESGEKAMEFLMKERVDLLVLDMIMEPGQNGLDTYEQIIKIRPGQKAIIVSGFSESENVKRAQQMGAGPFVRKPYSLETIGLAIRDALSTPLSLSAAALPERTEMPDHRI